jgi:hypothetical protein
MAWHLVADFVIWRLSRLPAARLLARMGLNAVHMSSSKGLDLNLLVHFLHCRRSSPVNHIIWFYPG